MNDCEAGSSGAVSEDFDVFLNHRGPDVKATFVAHLEDALRCAGFRPFLDAQSLMKGNPALKSIDQALEMAQVHVAVVSRRYAESKYCLNELVAMMRSGKPVVPVFYGVEPGDLRWVENGPFAEAFEKHQSRGRTQKKIQEWRDALRALAEITGFCLTDFERDEAKLKREVVNRVARLTPSNEPVEVEQYRVGLEGPANRCIQVLDNMGAGTGMLGLVGMGGVGKTTLAKELYNHFVAEKKFRCMTFLEIHRDSSASNVQVGSTWSRELRKQVLWDLLRVQDSTSNYSSWFQKVSTMGPVLIVVDDVHKLEQFKALIPDDASDLHPGSRIIVTSRDRSILNNVAGRSRMDHYLYDVSTLGSEESSMLFNFHAFNSVEAPEEYSGLAKDVVEACDGLPLALKVIGSSLFDKRLEEDRETIWPEAILALRQSTDVMGVLRWSYDSLAESEKHMFVDITCLFYDKRVKEALAFWESFENCTPHTTLRSLMDKNLVIVYQRSAVFRVHDLLIGLGQEIGETAQSHFVKGKVAEARVGKKQGTHKTVALNLSGSRKRKFEAEDFVIMPNLHFLELSDGCYVDGDLKCMSRELRWLRWRGMSYKNVPMGLDLSHLISLDFSESTNLASLWTESNDSLEGCPHLLSLNLRECTSITKLPDSIGQSSRLQNLNLYGCSKLKMLPSSIGQLKALENLHLRGCTSLKHLPDSIGQSSRLQFLHLGSCRKLKKLPDSIGQLKALESLYLGGCTSLKDLPDSIGQSSRLQYLELDDCRKLKKLPDSIGQLKELRVLSMWGFTSLKALPDTIGSFSNLQALTAYGCTSLLSLPPSIGLLSSLTLLWIEASTNCESFLDGIGKAWTQLQYLRFCNCDGLGSLLDYGALKRLKELCLEDNTILELPESIGQLICLEMLTITCERLGCLPKSIGDLLMLESLELRCCNNLKRLPKTLGALTSLKHLRITDCCIIRKLPRSVGQLSRLQTLTMRRCNDLHKLPGSIRNLQELRLFVLQDCGSIDAMGALTILQGLAIGGSTSVTKIPTSLGFVSTLVVYGDNLKPYEHLYTQFVGRSQVLEEDESGFLKAYQDESSGVTSLVRGVHKVSTST